VLKPVSGVSPIAAADSGNIRVLVVDHHGMVAEGIARILSDEANVTVVGTAGALPRAVELAAELRPSIVVADHLPGDHGSEVVRALLRASPDSHVIVLTASTDARTLTESVAAGCRGYVTKDRGSAELVHAVRIVHSGEVFVTQRMLAGLLPKLNRPAAQIGVDLTERESNVLQLMTEGMSNREIAGQLHLSVHTIRNHVQSVLTKLRVHSRLEAVIVANREGLLGQHLRVSNRARAS
jgi:DNA-binding NarL/FixJ family response regulator